MSSVPSRLQGSVGAGPRSRVWVLAAYMGPASAPDLGSHPSPTLVGARGQPGGRLLSVSGMRHVHCNDMCNACVMTSAALCVPVSEASAKPSISSESPQSLRSRRASVLCRRERNCQAQRGMPSWAFTPPPVQCALRASVVPSPSSLVESLQQKAMRSSQCPGMGSGSPQSMRISAAQPVMAELQVGAAGA